MGSDRRDFLSTLAATAVGAGLSPIVDGAQTTENQPARLPPSKRNSGRPLDVALFLDVEDIFSPPEVGNDDSIMELATILTEVGLRANFLFIGDRAELLRERGRQDVIDSLASHDVGLHTRSARHPTSPEYTAGKSWDEAVAVALKYEKEGAEIIRSVFGRPCAALSSHAIFDTPHNQHASAILGLPYVYPYPAAPPLYNLTWYVGALGLPFDSPTLDVENPVAAGQGGIGAYFEFFDDFYPDDRNFEKHLAKLDAHVERCLDESQPFLSLFLYHPQRLRLIDFIDLFWSPNGVTYPEDRWGTYGRPRLRPLEQVRNALVNFRRLARWVKSDPRLNLLTVTEVARKYGRQPDRISRDELVEAARSIDNASKPEILLHPRFSPAEIVLGMARAVVSFSEHSQLPSTVPRDTVLGPTRGPIARPELQGCRHVRLVELARELIDHVNTEGHLPATLGAPLERVGVNHLYRALAGSLVALEEGSVPNEVTFGRMPTLPEIATPLWIGFLNMIQGDLMDPDLDVHTLYRDTRLQTWTMKAAIIP
jgi:hypothetical protein